MTAHNIHRNEEAARQARRHEAHQIEQGRTYQVCCARPLHLSYLTTYYSNNVMSTHMTRHIDTWPWRTRNCTMPGIARRLSNSTRYDRGDDERQSQAVSLFFSLHLFFNSARTTRSATAYCSRSAIKFVYIALQRVAHGYSRHDRSRRSTRASRNTGQTCILPVHSIR